MELTSPNKARAGDKVAVVSPSFAAPAVAPVVHEQALERLQAVTGLVPVELPTTRKLDASARERADDLNAAFADPEIRAVLATIGGRTRSRSSRTSTPNSSRMAWVTELARHHSPATVQKIHRVLSLVLDMAVKDGRLARNVAGGVNLPRVRKHEHRYLTCVHVIAQADPAVAPVLPQPDSAGNTEEAPQGVSAGQGPHSTSYPQRDSHPCYRRERATS